jgi:hypothetical protein
MSKRFSANKVGGFGLGDFSSVKLAKDAIKATGEYGLYQIVDNSTGLAVWVGKANRGVK